MLRVVRVACIVFSVCSCQNEKAHTAAEETQELASATAAGSTEPLGSYLMNYFQNNNKRLIHKWLHYFEVYERHLSKYRGQEVTVVEIGVAHGGSLQMWKDYFGPKARVIGIDIDPRCKSVEEPQIEVFIGDQSDRNFWAAFRKKVPTVHIVIDDGGHTMNQQITTFEELFGHIDANGTYICEDTHTSYWQRFGGAYLGKDTFMEMSKTLVDQLNAYHSEQPKQLGVSAFTQTAHAMHYYDSVVVIEKRPKRPPTHQKTGAPSF